MKQLLLVPIILGNAVCAVSYETTFTGRVASANITFYEDKGIPHAMVVFQNKQGAYVSLTQAYATISMIYYCRELSPFTHRPDTNAYREERDLTIKPHLFQEITLQGGEVIYGLPIFRYDGVPWFSYDMNWYKWSPDLFYDKERICTKVSLHFNCRGLEAEGVLDLLERKKEIKKRIQ